jgi:hypothetical protein
MKTINGYEDFFLVIAGENAGGEQIQFYNPTSSQSGPICAAKLTIVFALIP